MIQVICDNCSKVLRDKPSEANPEAKPEKRVTLKMHVESTNSYPIDMDLCVSCAKRYIGVLKEPI